MTSKKHLLKKQVKQIVEAFELSCPDRSAISDWCMVDKAPCTGHFCPYRHKFSGVISKIDLNAK